MTKILDVERLLIIMPCGADYGAFFVSELKSVVPQSQTLDFADFELIADKYVTYKK